MVPRATVAGSVLVSGVDELDAQNCSSALTPKPVEKSGHCRGTRNESNDDSDHKSLTDTFCGSTMSASAPVLVGGGTPSDKVRLRFLNRLGFSPPRECNFRSTPRTILQPRLSSADSFQTPLVDHNGDIRPFPSSHESSWPQPSPMLFNKKAQNAYHEKGMKSVRFDDVVTVHPIPSYRA